MYSLILVDYNTIDTSTDYIAVCRKALGAKGAGHVVLVENGSNEGVGERLDALYGAHIEQSLPDIAQKVFCYQTEEQQIVYCHSGENLGYARGNNLGARIAKEYFGDDFCIISNNDVVFPISPDLTVADRLFAEHPEIGAIGPQVHTPQGESQSPCYWQTGFQRLILFYWKPLLRLVNKLSGKKSEVLTVPATGPCDWISGSFILMRMSAFFEAGMFDENTFLYAEELILSRRLESIGSQVWFCKELSIIHNHAQTTKKALSYLRTKEINFESICYYYKNYTDTSSALLTLAKANFWLHKTVFFCTRSIKDLLSNKASANNSAVNK